VATEHRHHGQVRGATIWYAAMTQAGFVTVLIGLTWLAAVAGADFAAVRAAAGALSPGVKDAVFVLCLVGFAAKAGAVPLHPWLPRAHAEAPSHVSALMSAAMVKLGPEHLLASSAIPFLFPAVPLPLDGRIEYFGDGSIRQIAPLSPAIHFGAERIIVLGAAAPRPEVPVAPGAATGYPTLAQIGQQVMASVFLDSIGADIERIEHINRMILHLPHQIEPASGWRHIEVLAIAPSERIELLAARHLKRLPLTVRGLLGAVGGNRAAGASFASYLLFEAEFASELLELGYRDTLAHSEQLRAWIAAANHRGVRASPPPANAPMHESGDAAR